MLAVVRNVLARRSVAARRKRPVLLCCDGSDRAEQAIRRSGALLDDPSAIVLYVGAGEGAHTAAEDGRRLALETGFDPVSVADAATGPVAETILAHAERHGVAAIVVGSRGLSASRATILGSVSSRVTQNARHPVLVVRPGPQSEPVRGPVFVCYDGSDAAGYAIATAGELSRVAMRSWRTSCPPSTTGSCCNRRCPGRSVPQFRTGWRSSTGRRQAVR
jgi:nucleotide-binding universal stress UspA family protein